MFAFTDTKALSEAGAWVHLVNPATKRPIYAPGKDGEPDPKKPVRIKVMGADSPTLQKRLAKRAARMLKARGAKMDVSKMTEAEIVGLIEEAPENKVQDAADATIGWENMPGADGRPVEYSRENVEKLYTEFPDMLRQIEEITGDIGAFTDLASRG